MRHRIPAILLCAVLAAPSSFAAKGRAVEPVTPAGAAIPELELQLPAARPDAVAVMIELEDVPATVAYANALKTTAGGSKSRAARRIASDASRSAVAKATRAQDDVAARIRARGIAVREIYRVQRALNAIAVYTNKENIAALQKLPGVKRVTPIVNDVITNSTSVPFIGAPGLWDGSAVAGLNADGSGIRIGIIDTGLDYLHANFGGSGLLADYQANDRTAAPDAFFPNAKVAGGVDLAGDAYTGGNVPVPDADPMDCNGHGTHVAGSAAGYGVNADGTTYFGALDASAPFAGMRIGPGVAPRATLYAIRVFGCGGSTGLTVQGIDWATDPDGDNDVSDHLDVINMSLGSNYGSAASSTAIAADNAAKAGVVVVASAGNAGDTFFISGSPGSSSRTIATAASVDDGLAGAVLEVNSPPVIAGPYAASAANSFLPTPAPAPTGETASVVLALDPADGAGPLTTDGCSALTNAAAIAGNIALVDRGTCGFQIKAVNAQNAGAIAVIIANNIVGDPNLVALGGTASSTVTIPTIMISLADRNTIAANLPVNATLAAADAGDTLASFSSRGPRGFGAIRLKPDLAAPGSNIVSAQTGTTCTVSGCQRPDASGFIPGSEALTLSGTSMASPHAAGMMALLLQAHPDWSVEELKAVAMNGSLHKITIGANGSGPEYVAGRTGAGRVDPAASAISPVAVFNDEEAGLVSVTFDTTQVVGTAAQSKRVRVVNHSSSAITFSIATETQLDAPGIAFAAPSSVTVGANSSTTFDVSVAATASQMKHQRDPSVSPAQAAPGPLAALGNVSRHWLTEEAGRVTLTAAGLPELRVPLYLAARPASAMSGGPIVTGGAPTGSTTIALTGTDVCTGTLGAGPTCTGAFPTDEVSLVTPFELQVVSPQNSDVAPPSADLRYAGVAFYPASNQLMFGVSTWGKWASPTETTFNIYVDNNEDGVWDRILFNSNPGTAASTLFGTTASGQDSFMNYVYNVATNGVSTGLYVNRVNATAADTAVFDNNVLFLTASLGQLGLSTDTTFRWKVLTCPGSAPLCVVTNGLNYDEAAGPFFFNYAAQGLDFGGGNLFFDLDGASLPVTWNTANLTTNGSLGALLLHHHNGPEASAQAVLLDTAQTADLAVGLSASSLTPAVGSNVTLAVTVTNDGPDAATGIAANVSLPLGLAYVSDDGAGAYSTTTEIWTIPALASGASTTLNIVATVTAGDPMIVTARATATSGALDTNAANDSASLTLVPPRSADASVAMSVSSPTALAGSQVTYTVNLTNLGADTAYDLNLLEQFPSFPALPIAAVPAPVASSGTYNAATGNWTIASLGDSKSATLTFAVDVPDMIGPLTNETSITSASVGDPVAANNIASATTLVSSPAVLEISKVVGGTYVPGGAITYTVVLTNIGTNTQHDNPGNEFDDAVSADVIVTGVSATSGTAARTGNTIRWNGSIPAAGTVTITITGTLASPLAAGTVVSNYATTTFDAAGSGSNDSTQTIGPINLTVLNVAPVAVDDAATTTEGSNATGAVLSNDTDANGDSLIAAEVSGPAYGSLTLNPDGTFTYTPNANFYGSDSFTYKASDGTSDSNVATVSITVTPLAPTIASFSQDSICQGSAGIVLTINGTNFVPGTTVTYGAAARAVTFVSSTQLDVTLLAADFATAGVRSIVVTKPSAGGTVSKSFTVTADALAPVVTAPAAIDLTQSACVAGEGGATPASSPALQTFLAASSALDGCTSVTPLPAQLGGVDITNATFFGGGVNTVTFRWQDGAGNIGTATADVRVHVYGDLTDEGNVDASDLVVMANHLVGNLPQGTAPFVAPAAMADLNSDATINAVDLVVLANHLVSNIPCVPVP